MSDKVNRLKFEKFNQERELLERQIEAVSNELRHNTDSEKQPVLESKLELLYEKLSRTDAELEELETILEKASDEKTKITSRPSDRISSYPKSAYRRLRPPHEVFPYLLDRNEQEEALVQALVAHRQVKSARPFVCVLHGDELECHNLYLKRLKTRSLPEILSAWYPLEAKNTPIEQFDVKLPLNTKTRSDYESSLWLSLRAATHSSKPVSEKDVINFIASHKLAIIMKSSLLTEDLKNISLESIDWFLKFWERWPEISSNLLLFVAISFKYQRNSNWRRHPIRNWSRKRLNRQIRRYLNQLDFLGHTELYGTVLPELVAIRQSDAEALIRHEQVSLYSDLEDQDIRTLYRNHTLCTPNGCIPMETLLDRLSHISKERQRYNNLRRF